MTTCHSGANPSESTLTPQNVNPKSFGRLFTQSVDGASSARRSIFPEVTIAGSVHNVVYVATMNDSVYAFDADSNTGSNASPLWHTSFLSKNVLPVPISIQGCWEPRVGRRWASSRPR